MGVTALVTLFLGMTYDVVRQTHNIPIVRVEYHMDGLFFRVYN